LAARSPARVNLLYTNGIAKGLDTRVEGRPARCNRSPLSPSPTFAQALSMKTEPIVSDTFTLSGENIDRLRQALKVVAHQARLAQAADYGRNVVDALVETEELARDQLARIDGALEDDRAEAEDQGVAERQRQASFPLYRAA
jgi:hypothetical protein